MAILLMAGQALAQVSVWVEMKQTGPTNPTTGALIVRVGKNVNATYSATAGYNGSPTMHNEEQVTGESWSYSVSADPKVDYSPTFGGGSSTTVTAKSAEAGTYTITATFQLTLTITKYKDDGSVESTRTDGPYTGSGSATLTVKGGKFNIKLEPDDKCKETATIKRSRERFGLGETGDIVLEPETLGETVVFVSSAVTPTDICTVNGQRFTLKNKPGSATITVKVTVTANGVSSTEEETIGITAIAPTGMVAIAKQNITNYTKVGAGIRILVYFAPKDVSFYKSILGEGYAKGSFDGKTIEHLKYKILGIREGDVVLGTLAADTASCPDLPLGTKAQVMAWHIPFGYYDLSKNNVPQTSNDDLVQISINSQIFTFDGQGGCTVTKLGTKATRVPNNVQNLLNAVMNNTDYKDG